MKKIILILIFSLFLVPTIIAPIGNLGTTSRGECVELIQTCQDCTYNNISVVLFPNKTVAVGNISMSKDDTYYSYSFCETDTLGTYTVNGFGNLGGTKTTWNYVFEVTGTGFELNSARAILFVGLLAVLIFLFLVSLVFYTNLPTDNNTDDNGNMISINKLKYLRPVALIVSYLLMMSILFTGSNIALAYLGTSLFGNLLLQLFQIMGYLLLPIIVIGFIVILLKIHTDKEFKKLLERGIFPQKII